MLRKLLKNKRAQNTAEYAILISLVVAGIIAMQTYAQRALQGRVRDAASYLKNETTTLGASTQYEPYYLSTDYTTSRNETTTKQYSNELTGVRSDARLTRTRESLGTQNMTYNNTTFGEAF